MNMLQKLTIAAAFFAAPTSIFAESFTWNATSGLLPNQLSPGMAFENTSIPETPSLANEVLTISNDQSNELLYYYLDLPTEQAPPQLKITSTMKVVAAPGGSARRASAIYFSGSPNVGNSLYIGTNEIFLLAADLSRGPEAIVDTTSSFHVYQIELSGTEAGSSVSVFQDGILKLTGTLFTNPTTFGSEPRIGFGDVTNLAAGTSEWKTFSYTTNPVTGPATTEIALYPGISISGVVGATYRIEYTLDLGNPTWTALTDIVLPSSPYIYFDASPVSQSPKRFYRVSSL